MPSDDAIPITLGPVAQTLLPTLSGRAQDSASPAPLLNDRWAADALSKLDYKPPQTPMDKVFHTFIVLRAKQFDTWTNEFLAAHPEGATVLHLACGLDSRALRVKWDDRVRWVDVDVPEVVELRRKILPTPPSGDYRLLEGDVRTSGWLEEVPADRPTLIIMEGLLMYLEKGEVEDLIKRICKRFGKGVILADVIGWVGLKTQWTNTAISRTGAVMKSAVDHGSELEGCWETLRVTDEVRAWQSEGRMAFPWYVRVSLWLYSLFPGLKTMKSDMRFEF